MCNWEVYSNRIFGNEDPIGKVLRIKNIPFRVIGILETKGGSMMGQDQDDVVVAPYETVRKKLMGTPTPVGIIYCFLNFKRNG